VRFFCPASGYLIENVLWSKDENSLSGKWLLAGEHSLVKVLYSSSGYPLENFSVPKVI
jgi:hypothetical protein